MKKMNGIIEYWPLLKKDQQIRAVPDFGSGSSRNPALFPNPAEIRLQQKCHHTVDVQQFVIMTA